MKYTKKKLYKDKNNSLNTYDIYAMPKSYYEFAIDNQLIYQTSDKYRNGYEYVYIHSNDDGIYWLPDEEFHNKYKLVE